MGKWFTHNAVHHSRGLEEPKDHSSKCYFCLTNITEITSKSKHTMKNPHLPSAMRSVTHREAVPLPKPLENLILVITTLILKKITDSQKGTRLIVI